MKKYLFVILAGIVVLLGCEQISKLTQFVLPVNYELNIPALPVTTDGYTQSVTVQPNLKAELQKQNYSNDFLEKVILKNASIELTVPETADLSFLKSIEVFISATNLPEIPIAQVMDIKDDVGRILPLIVESTDLKSYLLNDQVIIKVKAVTDKTTTESYTLKISSNFMVDVKVLGM